VYGDEEHAPNATQLTTEPVKLGFTRSNTAVDN
jgi:hypothetical protein